MPPPGPARTVVTVAGAHNLKAGLAAGRPGGVLVAELVTLP